MWTARRSKAARPDRGAAVGRERMRAGRILLPPPKGPKPRPGDTCHRRRRNIYAWSARQRRATVSTSVSRTVSRSTERAADDLEHVGGRGLLLKRLVTFPRSKVDLAVQLRCRLTCGRRLSPFTHTCSASAFGRSPLSFVSLHVAPSPRLADRMLPFRPASGGQLRGAATNRPTSV